MALTIGELVGYLKIDADDWHKGLAAARATLAKASSDSVNDVKDVADKVDRAGASFLQLALTVSKVAGAAATLHGTVAVVAQLGGVLGLLPAIGAAAAAGMVALKLGTAGFGDAMKAVGDPKKFAEALEKLSPAARETALAVRDLAPAWRAMQQSVQDALFANLARDVKALGSSYIPVLKTGLSGIANEFNVAARNTASFLGQSQQVNTVTGIFGNVRKSVGDTSSALQPLVSILLDVVAVGSEFLPGLSSGFGDSARSAADFVYQARESGKLREWIASGLDVLHQLGQIFRNVAEIAKAVFTGLDLGGAGLLDTLLRVTGGVKDFLQSFQGQEALRSLGTMLSTVSSVVTTVLMTALQQLAPVVIALAPGFAQLAAQVGSVLVSALQVAGPMLVSLATFLSENIDWLGPLAIGLYGAAQAFQVVIGVMRILNVVASLNPWVLLIAATAALVGLIVANWDSIKQAIGAAWQWLVDRASEVWGWIERNIIDHIANAARWVGDRVRDIVNFFAGLGSLPGKALEWFSGIARWAGDKLSEVVRFFRDLPGNILRSLGDLGSLLVNAGKDIVLGLLRGLENFAGKIWDWVKGIAGRIWDGITDFFDIFSPSKRMRYAGRMIGLGLATGLDNMTGTVTSSATDLAKAGMVTVPAPVIGSERRGSTVSAAAPAPAVPVPALVGAERGPLVHIEHYHPPASATPDEVATDLDWLMRGGGR